METITIIAPLGWSVSRFESSLADRWKVLPSEPGTLVVADGAGERAYLRDAPEVKEQFSLDGFASDALKRLLPAMGDASFMQLDYSDTNLAKQLLEAIADNPAIMIDNDFGTVLPGNLFVHRIRTTPNWDWRRNSN